MYPSKPGLLIGFHGCDLSVRNNIVSDKKEINPSIKDYEWLGKGFYFGENNNQRARDFAENHASEKKIKTPSELGAVLDLLNCLDLLDTEYLRLAMTAYQNLEFFAEKSGMELPINRTPRGSKDSRIRNLDWCSH